jgi:type I restriction enzyme S subunit
VGEFTTYLVAQHAVENLQRVAYGTVFDTITRKTFDSIGIPSPGKEIWTSFENIIRPWFEKILTNQEENVKLAEIRDYLLPKLLSGEIEVNDIA